MSTYNNNHYGGSVADMILDAPQRHPDEHKPLLWDKPNLPDNAYGYYGETMSMYCKVVCNRYAEWKFYRSGYANRGYLPPLLLEGVKTVEEAKAVAQVYYFINGWEIIDVVAANNPRRTT